MQDVAAAALSAIVFVDKCLTASKRSSILLPNDIELHLKINVFDGPRIS
jgi:hypothetical protein